MEAFNILQLASMVYGKTWMEISLGPLSTQHPYRNQLLSAAKSKGESVYAFSETVYNYKTYKYRYNKEESGRINVKNLSL